MHISDLLTIAGDLDLLRPTLLVSIHLSYSNIPHFRVDEGESEDSPPKNKCPSPWMDANGSNYVSRALSTMQPPFRRLGPSTEASSEKTGRRQNLDAW